MILFNCSNDDDDDDDNDDDYVNEGVSYDNDNCKMLKIEITIKVMMVTQ